MKQSFLTLLIACCLLLVSCSPEKQAASPQPEPSTAVFSSAAPTPVTTPVPLFVGDYESSKVYQAIKAIEDCTDPDQLQSLLTDVYGEDVTYIKLEIQEGDDSVFSGYKEPYEIMMCSVVSFYENEKAKAPINTDTWLFFLPYHEEPIFLVDKDGAFLVSKYEYHNFDDGTYSLEITGWVTTELFLLSQSYLNDECEHKFNFQDKGYETIIEKDFMAEAAAKVDGFAQFLTKITCYIEPTLGKELS